jgi:uncharacterized protein (TIGR02145 family)
MPNKIAGSSDYLTVSGSAGSETYQCPDTPAYIAADTDYIWFKTDETPRTTTTAELIGWDLQRTPVKYLDNSPNSIQWIAIRKSGAEGNMTTDEMNIMHTQFRLPIMWDGTWSDQGFEKSNRPLEEQYLWVPEVDAPTAPTNLVTTLLSNISIKLDWDANATTEDGYKIERSLTDENNYAVVETTAPSVDTWTDTTCIPGSKYYYRVRAFKSSTYSDYTNTDNETCTIKDADGNDYTDVVIGTQTWLGQNLKTTKYNDGSTINYTGLTYATRNADTEGSYQYPNAYAIDAPDAPTKAAYGLLYSGFAVLNAKGLAPAGYHIPTNAELSTLVTSVGGYTVAGAALKEGGTSHWQTPNTGADNSSGFIGVGAGIQDKVFFNQRQAIWSSTVDGVNIYYLYMQYSDDDSNGGNNTQYPAAKAQWKSIRCIKN